MANKKQTPEQKLKAQQKAFETKQKQRIAEMKAKLEELETKKFTPKASKVRLLNADEFKKRIAELDATAEQFKKQKKLTISDVAKWTDQIEPMLFRIIATAKAAKEKVLENMDNAKDKRQFRRLIDKCERTGLKAKDFIPAIKAQQNRIANISEDLADITKYLQK